VRSSVFITFCAAFVDAIQCYVGIGADVQQIQCLGHCVNMTGTLGGQRMLCIYGIVSK